MRVELRDEAREDLAVGAWFYEMQAPGLGDYFVDCLKRDLEGLAKTAGIHEVAYGFHRKLSHRFPFAMYYQITVESVDVIAVLDCREDPESTEQRLGRTTD